MFGKNKRLQEAKERLRKKREKEYRLQQTEGAGLSARLYQLKGSNKKLIAQRVLDLWGEAQHQVHLTNQSIADKTAYHRIDGEPLDEGDVATFIAEHVADVFRENVTNPQTVFEALSDQFPEVHFTVDWHDAASLTAAYLREERLAGVIVGLKLAGIKFPE